MFGIGWPTSYLFYYSADGITAIVQHSMKLILFEHLLPLNIFVLSVLNNRQNLSIELSNCHGITLGQILFL